MPVPPLPNDESTESSTPATEEAAEPVFDVAPKHEVDAPIGTTRDAGRTEDEGKGRVFPCPQCGADLVFHIGQQAMKCPFCGYEEAIAFAADVEVKERDFGEMLRRLQ